MPKRGRKFITEFLVPNLNEENFGARLAWVDREYSIFQMQWNHKAASMWKEDHFQVFVAWDKKQGHHRPSEKEYFTKSKQRFRAVLNKSIHDREITQLPCEDKNIKMYCFGPADAIPYGLKLDIVKDSMNDKNDDIESHFLNMESDLTNSIYQITSVDQITIVEQAQFSNTNVYCSALTDHNYQNNEEHKIPEINFDTPNNDLSLYTLCCDEKTNDSASFNILDITNEKIFLGNLYPLSCEKEHDFLSENKNASVCGNCNQVLCSGEICVAANSIPDSSSEMSLKRELEHFDLCPKPTKKSKILLYLKEDKS